MTTRAAAAAAGGGDGDDGAGATGTTAQTKLHMPHFDGDENKLDEFISKFETWKLMGKISNEEAAEAIHFGLDGEAGKWYINLKRMGEDCVRTWDALKPELTKRFTSKVSPGELSVHIDGLFQKKNEPVKRFLDRVHDVQIMIDIANRNLGDPLSKEAERRAHKHAVVHAFLHGLRKSIKKTVCAIPGLKTLDDYVEAATAAENSEKEGNGGNGNAAGKTEINELDTEVDIDEMSVQGGGRGRGRGRGRGGRGRGGATDFSGHTCFVCGQIGHISPYCPQRQGGGAQGGQGRGGWGQQQRGGAGPRGTGRGGQPGQPGGRGRGRGGYGNNYSGGYGGGSYGGGYHRGGGQQGQGGPWRPVNQMDWAEESEQQWDQLPEQPTPTESSTDLNAYEIGSGFSSNSSFMDFFE